jgi:hypothetical protein
MSVLSDARKEWAETMLKCPDDHTFWLTLFDGPTPIIAYPSADGQVVITVSNKAGVHVKMTAQLAARLSRHLAWAATEAMAPPEGEASTEPSDGEEVPG